MLFTSILYFFFLACTLLLYYIIPTKFRNHLLILASALFYMYAKPAYILIIFFIIITNFFIAIGIERAVKKKAHILYFSLFINLGILIFFKYWNFLIENFFQFLGLFHINNAVPIIDVVLPLGLSYYIFQTIGYVLDVYRGSLKAEKDIFHFSLFTLFFPKLLVGPIERASRFLPQLKQKIFFHRENLIEGSKRIAWGLFKKLVVADRIAIYQDAVLSSAHDQSGATLFFATILYTFQVYADFSGYTDIALGTARLFGYDLMENFKRPLFAKSVGDFWRRWHISLSSWVNDYIFNPIALNNRSWGKWAVFFSLIVSFAVIGIWHGPSWNYLVFGLLQAAALIFETVTKRTRKSIFNKTNRRVYNVLSILITFLFVSFSLIIFRSASYEEAMGIITGIFANSGPFFFDKPSTLLFMLIGCAIILMYDLQQEFKIFGDSIVSNDHWAVQQISYALLIIYIILAGVFDGGQFIYFSF